jgi:CheY-like chemotaxis protein
VPESIDSDPLRIQQVLTNLVGNAIKFTEVGSVRVRVRLVVCPPGHEWSEMIEFSVADTGIGIPEPMQKRLFIPFTQVDPTNTRKYGGTGLGLAISDGLVRLLRGTLDLTSREGEGTTFTFAIPCERSTSIVPPPEVPPLAGGPLPDSMEPHAGQPRILVVEDNSDSQTYFSKALAQFGAEVVVASDGERALEICAEREFALILMDIRMPNLDGFQTMAELRRRGYPAPVIAVTAHAMVGDREACIEAGFVDYLSKPVPRGVLLEIVEKYLLGQGGSKRSTRYSRHASSV